MSAISYKLDDPDIFTVEGAGWIEYFEFENDIWVHDGFSETRGSGVKLAREFIKYAKSVGKNIYGDANPQEHTHSMDLDRLKRWYHLLGGKDIKMANHPNAMRMETG